MSPLKTTIAWCSRKTGLSERTVFWSLSSFTIILLFALGFNYPLNRKIKQLDTEIAQAQAYLKELDMLQALDMTLTHELNSVYFQIGDWTETPLPEEHLLKLPSSFEKLAADAGVMMISFDPQNNFDGQQLEIHAIFQGDMNRLYQLLKDIGRISYVKRLEQIAILALPDGEQMELKFKVLIQ
jgi:hypothetical protein